MSNAILSSTYSSETTKLIPLTKWPEFHPWPSVAGLRSMVFNAKENEFERCVVKVGSRILINESKFFAWCESKSNQLTPKEKINNNRRKPMNLARSD